MRTFLSTDHQRGLRGHDEGFRRLGSRVPAHRPQTAGPGGSGVSQEGMLPGGDRIPGRLLLLPIEATAARVERESRSWTCGTHSLIHTRGNTKSPVTIKYVLSMSVFGFNEYDIIVNSYT